MQDQLAKHLTVPIAKAAHGSSSSSHLASSHGERSTALRASEVHYMIQQCFVSIACRCTESISLCKEVNIVALNCTMHNALHYKQLQDINGFWRQLFLHVCFVTDTCSTTAPPEAAAEPA
jgi:hypothetical protein